jgi:hypothetical protein
MFLQCGWNANGINNNHKNNGSRHVAASWRFETFNSSGTLLIGPLKLFGLKINVPFSIKCAEL